MNAVATRNKTNLPFCSNDQTRADGKFDCAVRTSGVLRPAERSRACREARGDGGDNLPRDRDGVSRLRFGRCCTPGIIFHDAT